MALNKGKKFEEVFKQCWKRDFPKTFLLRLYDTTNGYLGVANPCDYLAMPFTKLYMLECKSHEGTSIPKTAMPQYERMLEYKNMQNVIPGFIIWFRDKDKVIWCDIWTAEKIFNDGHKSIQLSMFEKNLYDLKELPSIKKRVFMDTDYKALIKLYEEIK